MHKNQNKVYRWEKFKFPTNDSAYLAEINKDNDQTITASFIVNINKKGANFISLINARKNKLKLKFEPKKPKFIGRRVFENIDLKLLSKFIDWSPFFQTWDLHGKYPNILKDKIVGESASQLFNEAQKTAYGFGLIHQTCPFAPLIKAIPSVGFANLSSAVSYPITQYPH